MADFSPTNPTVTFTKNDIGPTAGAGKFVTEGSFHTMQAELVDDFVASGLTLPATSASLSISVALGVAYVSGYRVSIPGATSVSVSASSTSYLFLKLNRDGDNNVDSVEFEVNTSGTAPADSLLLYTITSGLTTITATNDLAPRGRYGDLEPLVYMGM